MTVPVPLTADPTSWRHAEECPWLWTAVCSCGLSALREAVASGDPLAVLDLLGMGGTLEAVEAIVEGHAEWLYQMRLYRPRPRPLPDTPEVSP